MSSETEVRLREELVEVRECLRLIAHARDELGRQLHELLPEHEARRVLMAIAEGRPVIFSPPRRCQERSQSLRTWDDEPYQCNLQRDHQGEHVFVGRR